MIFSSEPRDWKDLQNKVCQIFNEMGYDASVEKVIATVRGEVEIDVYAADITKKPKMIYLCECKYWNAPIPQHVIHSFQTVVSNAGAHLGYIISKNGFQSGAYNAAKNSNIELLDWDQFQEMHFEAWCNSMHKRLRPLAEAFSYYFDYMSGPPRDNDDHIEWKNLCEKYNLLFEFSPYSPTVFLGKPIELPIICTDPRDGKSLNEKITIDNYRYLLDLFMETRETGIKAFEDFRSFLRKKHGRS